MRYFVYTALFLLLVAGCKKKNVGTDQNTDLSVSFGSSGSNESILIIDVRTKQEYSSGHLKEAINIPVSEIANKIENYASDKNQKILLYCLSGARSGSALKTLKSLGYTNAENLGSFEDAKAYYKKMQ